MRCVLVTSCCDNIHSQGRLWEERCVSFFGSQFEGPVPHGGEGAAAGVWDSRSHDSDVQEAERDECWSSFFSYSVQDPLQGAVLPSSAGMPKD